MGLIMIGSGTPQDRVAVGPINMDVTRKESWATVLYRNAGPLAQDRTRLQCSEEITTAVWSIKMEEEVRRFKYLLVTALMFRFARQFWVQVQVQWKTGAIWEIPRSWLLFLARKDQLRELLLCRSWNLPGSDLFYRSECLCLLQTLHSVKKCSTTQGSRMPQQEPSHPHWWGDGTPLGRYFSEYVVFVGQSLLTISCFRTPDRTLLIWSWTPFAFFEFKKEPDTSETIELSSYHPSLVDSFFTSHFS